MISLKFLILKLVFELFRIVCSIVAMDQTCHRVQWDFYGAIEQYQPDAVPDDLYRYG